MICIHSASRNDDFLLTLTMIMAIYFKEVLQ